MDAMLLLASQASARGSAPGEAGACLRQPRQDDKNDSMTRGRFTITRSKSSGRRRRARAWAAPSRSCRAFVALIAASRRTTC
jgi:hypothetical protein